MEKLCFLKFSFFTFRVTWLLPPNGRISAKLLPRLQHKRIDFFPSEAGPVWRNEIPVRDYSDRRFAALPASERVRRVTEMQRVHSG